MRALARGQCGKSVRSAGADLGIGLGDLKRGALSAGSGHPGSAAPLCLTASRVSDMPWLDLGPVQCGEPPALALTSPSAAAPSPATRSPILGERFGHRGHDFRAGDTMT